MFVSGQSGCAILKSKANNVNAIQEKVGTIDKVINDTYSLDESLEDLEEVRNNIEHLSNLSLSKGASTVKTTFTDRIIEVRNLSSDDFVNKTSVKTEVLKILDEYIAELRVIKDLESSILISDTDIDEIKYHVFDIDTIIEDKMNSNDDFNILIHDILNSSKKEVANKIFDNFISKGSYTLKQTEIINKIKNTLFGKKHTDIHESLINVKEVLFSDIHPLADEFEHLSENEQDGIYGVIDLISKVDNTSNISV